jgi:hypothetical protein
MEEEFWRKLFYGNVGFLGRYNRLQFGRLDGAGGCREETGQNCHIGKSAASRQIIQLLHYAMD